LRGAMQPTGEHRMICELAGAFGESNKDPLGHIFGEVWITHHSLRGGIDEIHVATHEFGERRFGTAFRVGLKEL